MYQVTVVDEGGCEGKRTFGHLWHVFHHSRLDVDPIRFAGTRRLTRWNFSRGLLALRKGTCKSKCSVHPWMGRAFLQVDIIHEDGTQDNSIVTLN